MTIFATPQQEYIAKSKYARYLDKEQRRETWQETVSRYFDFSKEHIKEKFPQAVEAWGEVAEALWTSVHGLHVMPSMRLLMTAGEAVKRNNISAYNCFGPDVSYMTKEGNKTFGETVGTTQLVLTKEGKWREAEVSNFGTQPTQDVHFRPGNTSRTALRHVVNVTPNHRWITTNRGEVTDLRVGDTVQFNAPAEFDLGDFRVVAIEEADEKEVFCVTEPVTGTFTLAGGILTGNCHYAALDNIRAFSDMLLILMHGTGSGFSVELSTTHRLPVVPELEMSGEEIHIKDSKEGWAKAYYKLLSELYGGSVPDIDYSAIRPKGARLKTFGGRASGPEPLKKLFNYTIKVFRNAQGRKLTPIEVHDIACMIADIVVVGGVRRSALISLSGLDDAMIAKCKSNFTVDQYSLINETEETAIYALTMKRNQPVQPTYRVTLNKTKQAFEISQLETKKIIPWYVVEPQRQLANNSVTYDDRPPVSVFLKEWANLIDSYSGERGFFNKKAARIQAERWGRRHYKGDYGCNPCSEILLRSNQMCNLSEVVVRAGDTFDQIKHKVGMAVQLGIFQCTLTDFKNVSPELKKNCEEERLLGVSMTGVMDHEILNHVNERAIKWLEALRDHAREVATDWANKLGIPVPTAITCVKPSGTVAQLVDGGTGGLHARHAPYYIRTYRQDNKDPMTQFLIDQGVSHEPSLTNPDDQTIFSFAIKSPEGAVTRHDRTAIEALDHWLMFQRHWCEHKPSVTVNVKQEEWMDVGQWVWQNFDEVSGVSFLPYDNGSYRQAPFQEITKDAYETFVAKYPQSLNWEEFIELDDSTEGSQELACTGNTCGT